MSKIKILILIAMVAAISACSIDEIDVFGDADYVYFPIEDRVSDVVNDNGFLEMGYTFVFEEESKHDIVYSMHVKMAGTPKPENRTISFHVVDSLSSATEGVHYELLPASESTIPAGEVNGEIKIKLLKTPEMNNSSVQLAITIIDNETLKAGAQPSASIEYSNFLLKPDWWITWYLGEFTVVKGVLWFEFMNVKNGENPWSVEPYIRYATDSDGNPVATLDQTAARQSVQRFVNWLQKGDQNGNPYVDENGNLVIDTF